MKKIIKGILWSGLVVLVATGIFAAIRQIPPHPNSYNPGIPAHPNITLLHVIPGLIFMLLGPFQFIKKIRSSFPGFHKFSGYLIVSSAILAGISSLIIVLMFPYAKYDERVGVIEEQIPNLVFGILFMFFAIRGVWYIRNKRIQKHRADMIRLFSIGLGISVFRILMIGTAILGISPLNFIAIYFWLGFGITYGIGEWYIRKT